MFKSIKAKNFLSWKDLSFYFKEGVSLIDGYNNDDGRSEGSGKTSVFEALSFGLFGKISRDVKINEIINETSDSCIVRVDFQNGDYIIRSRNPNDLYLVYNDTSNKHIRGKDLRETQKLIETYIGFSFDTFCQTIYFPQNYDKKFITASEEDKAKILSDIQNLSIYDRARKEVSDKLKNINKLVESSKYEVNTLEFKLNQYSEEKQRIDEHIKTFEDKKRLKLFNIKQDINKFEEDKTKIENDMMNIASKIPKENLNKLNNNIKKIENEIQEITFKQKNIQNNRSLKYTIEQQIENEIKRRDEYLEALAAPKGECSTCGSELDSTNKVYFNHLKKIEKEIDKINNNLNKLQSEKKELILIEEQDLGDKLTELNNELYYLNNEKNSYNELLNNINNYKSKIEELDNNKKYKVEEYNECQFEDCEELKSHINKINIKIKDVQLEYNQANNKYNELIKEQNDLQTLKIGFREVKSYVFKGLLVELNKNANRAISELFEQNVKIEYYNEDTEGEISKIKIKIIIDGKERSLGLLSGGQFRRVQIATDLALSQLVSSRSNKNINIRFFDESFKDLSETTIYTILDLLYKQTGCTILIEHNSLIKNSIDNKYKVELTNGVSQWVE